LVEATDEKKDNGIHENGLSIVEKHIGDGIPFVIFQVLCGKT